MHGEKFFLLVIVSTLSTLSSAHYVASNLTDCPTLDNTSTILCHELSFYTNQTEAYFTDDSIFIFLEGTHSLEDVLLISDVNNLTLFGMGQLELGFEDTVMETTVVLSCKKKKAGIMFINVTDLNLFGITITDCSYSPFDIMDRSKSVNDFYSYMADIHTFVSNSGNFFSSLFVIEVRNLVYQEMSIQNTSNFGLVAINVFNSSINSSSFAINNIEAFETSDNCSAIGEFNCSAGNLLIMYTYSWILKCSAVSMKAELEIKHSNFSYGFGNTRYSHFNSFGGGVTVFLDQGDAYYINVSMEHVVSYNNTGQLCGNVNFLTGMGTKYFAFSLIDSISSFGNQRLRSEASSGGGLQVSLGLRSELTRHYCFQDNNVLRESDTSIYIINSSFTHNIARYGAGINIWVNKTFAEIYFQSCQMVRNCGWRGIGMYINQNNFDTVLEYVFEDVVVSQSLYLGTVQSSEDYRSSISLFRMRNFTFVNLTVEDNSPNFGAYFYYSKITFSGMENIFRNCSSAGSGGGLHLSSLSSIILESNTVITFDSNHADEQGGAIYADTKELLSPLCFIEINNPSVHLVFINNTAGEEGNAVFIGPCSRLQNDAEKTNEATRILKTFELSEQPGDQPISSAPYMVMYCYNNDSIGDIESMNVTAYPGETIKFHIATLGLTNSMSSGLVKIDVYSEHGKKLETIYEYSQSQCFDILYTVHMPEVKRLTLNITTNLEQFTSTGFSLQKEVTALVDMQVCPEGFELFETRCVCNRLLERIIGNVTTDISTNTFTREGNVWFGYENDTNSLLVDSNCPFDYCLKASISFPIHNPDDQCNFNRTGKVCGQCAKGLSLMLGSNECGKCSNLWLLLIIPFSIGMGVALVALLITLNLTVSVGTMNGLIFYANIIKLNEYSFFQNGSVYILSQFIAWINLDFGINSCFYDGFDVIAKLWIQFVFPAYIFGIIIFIIILCKLSTKATKVFGHNAVQVFATLILLSYTKLFRLVVPIVQFKQITNISNTTNKMDSIVWPADASIPYTSLGHMPLVVLAILVLLIIVIPFTLILIFQPMMLKLRQDCFQKLCLKFKPLFDAYYGPFKDKSKIWPGLLLGTRLFLVIIASVSTDPKIYLACCTSVVVVLLTLMIGFQGVYTNTYLNILESCFLLNLAVIAIFVNTFYYITLIGVSIALAMFVGILVFHACSYKPLNKLRKIIIFNKRNIAANKESSMLLHSSGVHVVSREHVMTSSIDVHIKKREPLIYHDD